MDTSDIVPTAPPQEKRCTAHVFQLSVCPVVAPFLCHGFPLWISNASEDQYPPAILFDGIYAGVVLHHFGTQTLKDGIATTWKDTFSIDEQVVATESQRQEYEACHNHDELDTFDMLITLPYIMVPPDELQAVLRETREEKEAAEQRCVKEKVDQWLGNQGPGQGNVALK
jgi:hypothetical protein